MNRIEGSIHIYMDIHKGVSDEIYIAFEKRLNEAISKWNKEIEEIANDCGFKPEEGHPMSLSYLDYYYGDV